MPMSGFSRWQNIQLVSLGHKEDPFFLFFHVLIPDLVVDSLLLDCPWIYRKWVNGEPHVPLILIEQLPYFIIFPHIMPQNCGFLYWLLESRNSLLRHLILQTKTQTPNSWDKVLSSWAYMNQVVTMCSL